ncbi:MAG: type II toxin-antitoxin system VapC family toxin [Wenzhouxiangellaceae bacterium]|nr:type II toxin-antitoxin system VapC family toxin [Wenzhouxiangellaceae bacterium]
MNVLDASALLAFLFRERGHDVVEPFIRNGCIGSVNLSEVLGRFSRDGHDPQAAFQRLQASPIEIVPFGRGHAVLAAALEPRTRALGLSLGDRACLALAIERKCPVLAADRVWSELDVPIEIIQIRAGAGY